MRRFGSAVLACLALSLAGLAATAGPAHATYTPTAAPYVQTVNDTPLTNLLQLPDAPPLGATRPTVPGFTYPSAWNDAADVATKARMAGRFLPALRVLGTVGLATTAFTVGWKIGSLYVKATGIGPAPSSGVGTVSWNWKDSTTVLSGSGFSSATGSSPGPGWYLRDSSAGYFHCWPDGPFTTTAWNTFAHGAGAPFLTTTAAGTTCSAAGATYVTSKSEAAMSSAINLAPSNATEYGALPVAQQHDTGSYTQPTGSRATDLTNARAVLGNPVATLDTTTGTYKDAGGNPLTSGQVQGQADLNCELDASYCAGGTNDPFSVGSPLASVFVMPDCVGAVVAVCSSTLAGLGFTGTLVDTDLGLAGADVTKPAGAIVSQPTAGSTVPKTGTLTVTRNPTEMPVLLPQPLLNETYDQYITRIQTLGYLGVAVPLDLTELSGQPQLGPQAPVRIHVPTTTSPTAVLNPLAWPLPLPRISPHASITIDRNPATYPPATSSPPAPGSSPPSGGLDFSPLSSLDPGCKFPYGLFCYAKQVTDWFRVTPEAPSFNFTFPSIGGHPVPGGGHYNVDLAEVGVGAGSLDHYMGLLRDLMSVALWVGAVWLLASRFLGLNLGDPGEAIDDA